MFVMCAASAICAHEDAKMSIKFQAICGMFVSVAHTNTTQLAFLSPIVAQIVCSLIAEIAERHFDFKIAQLVERRVW